MSTQLLEQLKALPSFASYIPQEEPYPFSLFSKGIPKSGLVELSGPWGSGKTEVILRFLSENHTLKTAWIEREFNFFPPVLMEHKLGLRQTLFIDLDYQTFHPASSQKTPLWCAFQILRSEIFKVLVFSQIDFTETELRRLQLLTKQTGTLIFFLKTSASQQKSWPLSLQLGVKRTPTDPHPVLTLIRAKGFSAWPTLV